MKYNALLFKDRCVCSANSVQLLIHCEWFYLTQRYFVIHSKNSNLYFRILWMKSRNYTTNCTRPLKNATLTEIQSLASKNNGNLEKGKTRGKRQHDKAEDRNRCDNRQPQLGQIQKKSLLIEILCKVN